MTALVVRGDARTLPLPDACVDLVVTSPPYFALRSYTDGGEHYAGQIGSEATPAEYIAALIECTREWVRVLKPSGSMFVDLGDKYGAASWPSKNGKGATGLQDFGPKTTRVEAQRARAIRGGREKSLMLLPERYRIAAVDQLGLIARAVVIWSKPNGLPESVQDRVRRSHEDWVHLVRQPRYFSAVDEIRQPHANPGKNYGTNGAGATALRARNTSNDKGAAPYVGPSPLGALPGSVWTVATEPLTVPADLGVDHFAAFPTEWPRRIIQGWSPSGICTACGEGRRPVVDRERPGGRRFAAEQLAKGNGRGWNHGDPAKSGLGVPASESRFTITGEVCACPEPTAPTRPAVILDPFGGTGTAALVARALGRVGITVDRSADYSRLAQWRVSDPGQLAKVLGVPKPPQQLDGQAGLFEVAS